MAAGLVGGALSPHNMRRVFGCLRSLCRDEGHGPAAAAIAAQEALFEAVLAAEAPDRLADGEKLPFGDLAPRPALPDRACGKPVKSAPENPDILSQNPDILSSPHNKDSSPSRITPFARETASAAPVESAEAVQGEPGAGPALFSASTAPGGLLIDPETVLGHVEGGREACRAFVAAFRHRPARVTPDGVLAIRARSEREAFALCRDWLAPLTAWAAESGLSGVVFEAAAGSEATGPP
ncbi:MAG: hypothetical protein IPK75_01405 [Acidobacteria bacterium]|nr:hypothetical protein [Acidobacteriota bacterium]